MTPIRKPLRRLSNARVFSRGKNREVVVELSPPGHYISFRLKGEHTRHVLPIDFLYKMAAKATVEEIKRAKKEARKAARNA